MATDDRVKSPYRDWKLPNVKSRCTYHDVGTGTASPHSHQPRSGITPAISSSILSQIGNTPLVRLDRIRQKEGLECELLAKCEYFNAAGSVKDRVALRMVEDAERKGILKPGDTIIEPSSGNTGIGLALVAAIKGYKCIIALPEHMSVQKVDVLRALGARIVRTPTGVPHDSPDSHYGVVKRLMESIPDSHIFNQYGNPNNPLAHYDGTAEEIIEACEGNVDMMVMCAGTGGSIMGLGRKIKEKCPNCKIIGVDPDGSTIAEPQELNVTGVHPYLIEGIGHDFVPTVCDVKAIDFWYKCNDKDSFTMASRMIKDEGLLCGGSSGCAMSCAVRAARDHGLKKEQKCVVLLPDSIRNYMTTFLNDDWMVANGFTTPDVEEEWWWNLDTNALDIRIPQPVHAHVTLLDALEFMNHTGVEQAPVIDEIGCLQGVISVEQIMSQIVEGGVQNTDLACKVMRKNVKLLPERTTLLQLSRILNTENFVLISNDEDQAIVTRMDLIKFIMKQGTQPHSACVI